MNSVGRKVPIIYWPEGERLSAVYLNLSCVNESL